MFLNVNCQDKMQNVYNNGVYGFKSKEHSKYMYVVWVILQMAQDHKVMYSIQATVSICIQLGLAGTKML